ncbi:RNA 3'-terminal phosphate cyclase-like [Penaeus indicus]|uniref:RNA 3'-terminal phosphate cyclase-like n=1 Tax=Penaeus indicus TaxID=29960 RepID=UPI00300D4042
MAAVEPIAIDGSFLEGGGQILRMGLALSSVRKLPITVTKIRAGRPNPGLRPQHLTGLQLVRDTSNGRLEGGEIGSMEISFYPGHISGGKYVADTQTAGSVSLLIQAALPCALYASSPTYLTLSGGTNAEMAPQVDYTIHVFRKVSAWFGADFRLFLHRRGFYPQGRGEVSLEVKPARQGLIAADFTDFGEVISVYGKAYVAGVLPIRVAHKMADAAENLLYQNLPQGVKIRVDRIQEHPETAVGSGSGIVLWAETTSGCILGGSSLGKKGKPAEQDGENAAKEILDCIKRKACLDSHSQDQVILFMALAKGKSIIRTGPLTDHTKTAIHVAELMTKVKFTITEDKESDCIFIECDGLGLTPKDRK